MRRFTIVLCLCALCAVTVFSQNNLEEIGYLIFYPDRYNRFANPVQAQRQLDAIAFNIQNRNLQPGQVYVIGYAADAASSMSLETLSLNRTFFIINELVRRGVSWELFAQPEGQGASFDFGQELNPNRRTIVAIGEPSSTIRQSPANIRNNEQPHTEHGTACAANCDCPKVLTGIFIGFGPEVNANSRTNLSFGGYFTGGFELLDTFAIGFKFFFSTNLDTVTTFEPAVLIRYMPFNGFFEGVFAEMLIGSASYYEDEDGLPKGWPAPLGGIGLGWRFRFNRFYIEPCVRYGHPFTWGVGLTAGLVFK